MGLLETIKKAGAGAVEAGNPVAVLYGTVTKIDPLEVNVHQRLTFTEDFLVIPERLTRYEVDLMHRHTAADGQTGEALTEKVAIREGLQVGDRVLLLRIQGGQQYAVLDKVVS